MIIKMFKTIINLSIIIYINDILIYCQTKIEHEKLFKDLLSHSQKWNLAYLITKYDFYKSEIEYLYCIISSIGIDTAQGKVKTILQ
jgi:hypothetical protein